MNITVGHVLEGDGWAKAWPLEHPTDWMDPESGLQWSRKESVVLSKRAELLAAAESSASMRRTLLKTCRQSFAFWRDHFVWSLFDQTWDAEGKLVGTEGAKTVRPYIGWPINDGYHAAFRSAVKLNRKFVVPKAREMMATWHMLCEHVHTYLFEFNQRTIIIAEKADKVDGPSPDALFPRMRFILTNLPWWMRADNWDVKRYCQSGALVNPLTGSSIVGDTTTANVGRGQRPVFITADEADFNESLAEIIVGTNNATRCLALISSINPRGSGAFKAECFKSQNVVFPMGYWSHPAKGRARAWSEDTTGQYTNSKGKLFWWTPYIQNEIFGRGIDVRSSILPNEMIDFGGGQNTVFDPNVLANMIANSQHNAPSADGDIVHVAEGYARDESLRQKRIKDIKFKQGRPAPLRLWCPLLNGRPPQDTQYVLGADVSNGLAASNSVVTVIDVIAARRVATWTSTQTDPAELSRVLVMLSLWFGGRGGQATICWETNGPGQTVGKFLRELGAQKLYAGENGEPGWTSSRANKQQLVEQLRIAYERGRFTDWDAAVLQECQDWIYGTGGWVGPSKLRRDGEAEATHGDRVVSTMIAWHVAEQVQRVIPAPKVRKDLEEDAFEKLTKPKKTRGNYAIL